MSENQESEKPLMFPTIPADANQPPPSALSMDEYTEFLEAVLSDLSREQIRRQLELRKPITERFRLF